MFQPEAKVANSDFISRKKIDKVFSVVGKIYVDGQSGSGFLVRYGTEIFMLTCFHVIEKKPKLYNNVFVGFDITLASQVWCRLDPEYFESDEKWDYAIVRIHEEDVQKIQNREPLLIASCWGHPLKNDTVSVYQHPGADFDQFSTGVLLTNQEGFFVHDATTLPGSSGSPIFNGNNQLIGIHRGTFPENPANHAIAITLVLSHLLRVAGAEPSYREPAPRAARPAALSAAVEKKLDPKRAVLQMANIGLPTLTVAGSSWLIGVDMLTKVAGPLAARVILPASAVGINVAFAPAVATAVVFVVTAAQARDVIGYASKWIWGSPSAIPESTLSPQPSATPESKTASSK